MLVVNKCGGHIMESWAAPCWLSERTTVFKNTKQRLNF